MPQKRHPNRGPRNLWDPRDSAKNREKTLKKFRNPNLEFLQFLAKNWPVIALAQRLIQRPKNRQKCRFLAPKCAQPAIWTPTHRGPKSEYYLKFSPKIVKKTKKNFKKISKIREGSGI